MICNQSTWVPHFHVIAGLCHQLRALYIQNNLGDLGGRNCATIFYRRVHGGNICHVTNSSVSGVGTAYHSEIACRDDLLEREGWTLAHAAGQIEFVYTERYPCGPENANCHNVLLHWLLPNTAVFWSFNWPDASDIYTGDSETKQKDRGPDWDEAKRDAKSQRAQGTKDLDWSMRDIDYSGGGGPGAIATALAGEIKSPMLMSVVSTYSERGTFPAPVPSIHAF